MNDLKLPRGDDPCPHCGRPMQRPVLERLSNPYCVRCLPERRAAAVLIFGPSQRRDDEATELKLYG